MCANNKGKLAEVRVTCWYQLDIGKQHASLRENRKAAGAPLVSLKPPVLMEEEGT